MAMLFGNSKMASQLINTLLTMLLVVVLALSSLQAEANASAIIGNALDTPLTVHCIAGSQDKGGRVLSPGQFWDFTFAWGYLGPFACSFAAAGKPTTTFDVYNSACKCDSFNGCQWEATSAGFTCGNALLRHWG